MGKKRSSWDELAGILDVSIRNIHRWKHMPDAPKSAEDVDGWRQWMAIHNKGMSPTERQAFTLPSGVELPGHCSYDQAIAKGYPAPEALRREQIREQELKNAKLQNEVHIQASRLFTTEQIKARDDKWNAAAQLEAEKVQRLVDGIEGVTPAIRAAFLDRYREWRKTLGDHLSKVHG